MKMDMLQGIKLDWYKGDAGALDLIKRVSAWRKKRQLDDASTKILKSP
jgi:hypothetical protein